jgi:tetratricopeptide (TPR) repeat protein
MNREQFDTAVAHHRAGRLPEAARLYSEVLAEDAGHADSLHLLGVVAHQLGRPDLAIDMIGQAIARDAAVAAYHGNLGRAHADRGRLDLAVVSFRHAAVLAPDDADAQYNLGLALARTEPRTAESCLRRAIELRPTDPRAHTNLGVVLHRQGQREAAANCFRQAIALHPDDAEAINNLGLVLREQGKLAESAACFDTALLLRPDDPATLNNFGSTRHAQGDAEGAIDCFRRAIARRPDYQEALYNLGTVLSGQGRLEEAIDCFRNALALRPDDPVACNNLGATLCEDGQIEEAMIWLQRAIDLNALEADAHANLGIALARQGRHADAVDSYRRAIVLRPDAARAHTNLAQALLALGDLPAGWRELEWRWQTPGMRGERRDFSRPQWRGGAAAGATLLIHAEQGFGDTLQFCRYARLAAARGLRVVMEVPAPLLRLLRGLDGVDQLVARGDPLPRFDLHCPMLSLPLALGTDLTSIPAAPAYLQADPAGTAQMAERLAAPQSARQDSLRVGLAWAGQSRPHLPGMTAVDRRRSVPPALLAPLLEIDGVHCFSLQKAGPAAPPEFLLTDLMEAMADFADTAALIANLDLVIAADTAVAHLAGALGRPVWLLDRFDHCWRWLAGRSDSPWYPTLRIYRQPAPGDWTAVIAAVTRDLRNLAAPR